MVGESDDPASSVNVRPASQVAASQVNAAESDDPAESDGPASGVAAESDNPASSVAAESADVESQIEIFGAENEEANAEPSQVCLCFCLNFIQKRFCTKKLQFSYFFGTNVSGREKFFQKKICILPRKNPKTVSLINKNLTTYPLNTFTKISDFESRLIFRLKFSEFGEFLGFFVANAQFFSTEFLVQKRFRAKKFKFRAKIDFCEPFATISELLVALCVRLYNLRLKMLVLKMRKMQVKMKLGHKTNQTLNLIKYVFIWISSRNVFVQKNCNFHIFF